MCGISGVFATASTLSDEHRAGVVACGRHQNARGPDAFGIEARDSLHFAHNRLSIIDLAAGGQPMIDDDSGNVIVFNGEIYNYLELRETLVSRGHRFRTHSDTEVLLKAYREYGVEMFQQLNGMFAFALFDAGTQALLLARDRFGEKPLYFFRRDDRLAFSSTLSGLQRMVGFPRESNPAALAEYLAFGYVSGPGTLYRDVWQLAPGHYLQFDARGLRESRYWSLPPAGTLPPPSDDELTGLLHDSIRLRLRADVPVATLLSGGIDSSMITLIAQKASSRPIHTFSFGWPNADSELPWAREIAKSAGTMHSESLLERDVFVRDMDGVVAAMDMPLADSAAFVVFQLSKQIAAAGIKVVLTGEGGDELFGGYPWYLGNEGWKQAAKRMLRGRRAEARDRVLGVIPFPMQPLQTAFGHATVDALIDRRSGGYHRGGDVVNDRIGHDYDYFLPWLLLPKVDRMSMAHSVEMRAPLLDHRLAEMWIRVSGDAKVRHGVTKYSLKEYLRRSQLIRAAILDRPKTGMNLPISWWIRQNEPLFRDGLGATSETSRLFGRTAVDTWFEALHREAGDGWSRSAQCIWTAFIWEAWSQRGALPAS